MTVLTAWNITQAFPVIILSENKIFICGWRQELQSIKVFVNLVYDIAFF